MVTHIKARLLIATLSLAVGISVGASLCSSAFAAVVTSSTATVNVSTSCSMTATINTQHTANLVNGQESTAVSSYSSGIGKTTIATTCNDTNGFSIYAAGYTGDKVGAANSTKLVGVNTGVTIPTGSGTSASNWSMKITAASGATNMVPATIDNGFDEYSLVPSNYTKVAHVTTATYQGAPTQITTTYRAYVSPTQAADSYSGKVRYVLIHPSSAVAQATFDSAFANAGKSKVTANDGNEYYAMQDMTADICNGVVDYGTETQLVDTRDKKLYWVLKAQDGKCWMTQNLDLDLKTDVALTSLNTDLNVHDDDIYNENLGYTYNESTGLITWTPSSPTNTSNATHANGTATGTSISWSNTNTTPRSVKLTVNGSEIYQKDGSTFSSATCNYFTTPSCLNSTGDNTNTTANFSTVPYEANGEHGKVGNYYNWSAAVASNNTSSRTASTYNAIAESPKNSICPKGWRLTRSSSTPAYNDFQNLYSAYSSSIGKANGYPLWLVRAGGVDNGTLGGSGDYGLYWSSTVNSASNAYYLNIRSDYFYPSLNRNRGRGFSVRCVAR
ncbi:hypothetical protein IJI00_01600 [Candidatus Saccharibacteria bacterium]|nr:hypothetical protein [Candidatus Saccharibacteria bacterium]